MDYEKLHKETLQGLQKLVAEGKITEDVAKQICPDFIAKSKDERIRKSLLSQYKGFSQTDFYDDGITFGDVTTWLERQKDSVSNAKYIQDIADAFEDGRRKDKQNPTEWSNEDKTIKTELLDLISSVELSELVDEETQAKLYHWIEEKYGYSHWKPSKAQITALKVVARGFPADDLDAIDSLLDDLKSL